MFIVSVEALGPTAPICICPGAFVGELPVPLTNLQYLLTGILYHLSKNYIAAVVPNSLSFLKV